jgi:hydrogenase nickel incorporation protein HypA/HybF
MHELGVATEIVDLVTRVMDENSARKVGEIAVEVGTLSCVDPGSLEFCFQAITKGTRLENARLKIKEIKPRARCRVCKEEYEVRWDDFRCRSCGAADFDLLIGREISVREVEVE